MLKGCVHCVFVSVRVIRWVCTGVIAFFHATFGLFALMKLGRKKRGLLGVEMRREDGQYIREKGYF